MASIPCPERPDGHLSVQVAAAVAMLRRGGGPDRVAVVTGVPLALVDLIAEYLVADPATQTDAGSAPGQRQRSAPGAHRDGAPGEGAQFPGEFPGEFPAGFSVEDRWSAVIELFGRRQRSHRRRIRIMRVMVICWMVDTVVGAVAGLAHLAVLADAVLILGPLILAVLLLAAFTPPRPVSPPGPPAVRGHRPSAR